VSDYHINVLYSDEDGDCIADIPDLDACSEFDATPEEALAEGEHAREARLGAAREAGRPIRGRATAPRSTLGRSHSGCIPRNASASARPPVEPPQIANGLPLVC
jgi:predicted RNase H-like HicB family nuclease